jgi:HlyD family secretion protein
MLDWPVPAWALQETPADWDGVAAETPFSGQERSVDRAAPPRLTMTRRFGGLTLNRRRRLGRFSKNVAAGKVIKSMSKKTKARRSKFQFRLTVVVCTFATIVGIAFGRMQWPNHRSVRERYITHGVHRTDLFPIQLASGDVQSGKRTVIECQLENIAVGVKGQRLTATGASVLLSVIPEGSVVKRGDVLAVLDSADYEELLRLQRITLERAQADKLQADLDVEIAKLAVREFKEGTLRETNQDFEGKVFLARSELERAIDRLGWSRRMNQKGYIPAAAVTSDRFRKDQTELALQQQESAYALFKNFTAPKTVRELEGAEQGARAILEYQQLRLQRQLGRLATLEKQVENCTIRAPHDGFVIYANEARRELFIEPGLPVRERQQLFFLPDLNDMEVVAMLHESIVDRIDPGMRATVQIEGMTDRRIEAHVTRIATMPVLNVRSDVKYFEGIVKLENVPSGLKPGMSAEVEIALPRVENVLAVPSDAVRFENGHDVCFVIHEDGLERREVKLGQVTSDLSEVTDGLEEGEQVVINPPKEGLDLEESPVRASLTTNESAPRLGPATDAIAALH